MKLNWLVMLVGTVCPIFAMDYEFKKPSLNSNFLFVSSKKEESRALLTKLTNNNAAVMKCYSCFADNVEGLFLGKTISEHECLTIFKAVIFAAQKHAEIEQTCKDAALTPYIIHPLGVANNVISVGDEYNADIIVAALLHDTVKDTKTTFEEIERAFGKEVEAYVREVTDDKKLEIDNAHHKSLGAAIIKYSDTLYNLKNHLNCPPVGWSPERIAQYFMWSEKVVNNLPLANISLRKAVDATIKQFKEQQQIP